jgi:predicted exporter
VSLSLRRRRILGWSLLGIFAALSVAWLAQLDYAKKISTDVLDLIPSSERAPEIALVRELASQAEARGMFFVLARDDGSPAPAEAALRFAAALQRSAVFDQASARADTATPQQLGN